MAADEGDGDTRKRTDGAHGYLCAYWELICNGVCFHLEAKLIHTAHASLPNNDGSGQWFVVVSACRMYELALSYRVLDIDIYRFGRRGPLKDDLGALRRKILVRGRREERAGECCR